MIYYIKSLNFYRPKLFGSKNLDKIEIFYFNLLQINIFIFYWFHSKDPCDHSFNMIMVRVIIKALNRLTIVFRLFLFIRTSGVSREISTSKIKNIIKSIRKFVEKDVFLLDTESKPHSNAIFFSLFFFGVSINWLNSFSKIVDKVAAVIIRYHVISFIGF